MDNKPTLENHVLDLVDELIYISDVNTYELLYVNNRLVSAFGLAGINTYGRMCYEVLQNRSTPCPYCTNSFIREDEFYIWENKNCVTGKKYILKDKIINWNSRRARLEIAIDITEKEIISKTLQDKLDLSKFVVSAVECLTDSGIENTDFDKILKYALDYYNAERAFIFEYSYSLGLARNTHEICAPGIEPQIDFLQNLTFEDLSLWNRLFESSDEIVIKDLEEMRYHQTSYTILKAQNINNLLAVATRQNGRLIGFVGVDNPKNMDNGCGFLQLICYAFNSHIRAKETFNSSLHKADNPNLLSLSDNLLSRYSKIMDIAASFILSVNYKTGEYQIHKEGPIERQKASSMKYGELIKSMSDKYISPDNAKSWHKHMTLEYIRENMLKSDFTSSYEYLMLNDLGAYVWYYNMYIPFSDEEILIAGININSFKVRTEMAFTKELKLQALSFKRENSLSEARYRVIVDKMVSGIFEWCAGEDDLPLHVDGIEGSYCISEKLERDFGFKPDNHDFAEFFFTNKKIHPDDIRSFHSFMTSNLNSKFKNVTCRITNDGKNYRWYKITLVSSFGVSGQPERRIYALMDVNDETETMKALEYRAERDVLTGLFNQDAFYSRGQLLLNSQVELNYFIITMDIDKFKVINDLYGLDEGNKTLTSIGKTLEDTVGNSGICSRLYADVFCAMIKYDNRDDIFDFIDNISERLAKAENGTMLVPSFGICEVLDRTISMTRLCEMSGFAHKSVKQINGVHWRFYDDIIRIHSVEEKQLESEMSSALANGEFVVYLQPKYDIMEERVVGAEALVRWLHPVSGIVPPSKFIPLFEKNGFIIQLDAFVWEQSFMLLRKWIDEGKTPIPISVNVSRLHLHSKDFKNTISSLAEKYNIENKYIELELTESLFVDNFSYVSNGLEELRTEGFKLNMDDFGSGYSSLNMLKDIKIDTLKIDCAFFNEVTATSRGKTIVKHTIAMANDLNLNIVAEGVETQEQVNFLRESNCRVIQGFYFSPPIPYDSFEEKYL